MHEHMFAQVADASAPPGTVAASRTRVRSAHTGSSLRAMSPRTTPPFRADHVGSLLRPPALLQAREDFKARAASTPTSCAGIEDEAIRDVVRKQEEVGLQSATDGEFRRASWHMDFIYQLGGITTAQDHIKVQFRNAEGTIEFSPAALHVEERVALREPIFADAFTFVQDCVTTATPKLTIPSPSMVHYRGGRAAVNEDVYPDMDEFWSDLTSAYADEVKALGDLGCTYLQFDDTSLAYLNDPKQREHVAALGRRRRAPARDLHPPHQRGARGAPRGHDGHHAHVPRQLPLLVGGRGRLRLRGRGALQRARRSTASSWSGTTRARAASSRCASCPRASTSSSASSPPRAARSRPARTSSAASRRPAGSSTSTSSASRRSAGSPRRRRATPSPRSSSGTSCA